MTSIAEFAADYAERSNITLEAFWRDRIVLPCLCESIEGPHWAAIRRDDAAILDHLAFHCPKQADLLVMSHAADVRYLEERRAKRTT